MFWGREPGQTKELFFVVVGEKSVPDVQFLVFHSLENNVCCYQTCARYLLNYMKFGIIFVHLSNMASL